MDYIHQPYIGYIQNAAGDVFRVAWVETQPNAKTFPLETSFRSTRYFQTWIDTNGLVGALPTDSLEWSPYAGSLVPPRVCGNCYLGDSDWWTTGDWPSDAPPVTLGPDGFALNCKESEMGVQSVGLAAPPIFRVSGSPVVSRGILSFDWVSAAVGQVPTVQADGSVAFQDPSAAVFPAILGNVGFTTALKLSGVIATIGTASTGISVGSVIGKQLGVGMLVDGPGIPLGAELAVWDINASAGGLDMITPAAGTPTCDFTPLGYDWQECWNDPDTGELQIKPGGRTGTFLASPAVSLNPSIFPEPFGSVVWMRFRGMSGPGIPVYEFFPAQPLSGALKYGFQTQLGNTTINYYGNNTYPTNINLNVNTFLNWFNGTVLVPVFSGGGINPALLPPAGGTYQLATDSGSTTTTAHTVLDYTRADGCHGCASLANVGSANNIGVIIVEEDWRGTIVNFGPFPLGVGSSLNYNFDDLNSGGLLPPIVHWKMQVIDFSPGSHADYDFGSSYFQ
jgi:hypothetical protein